MFFEQQETDIVNELTTYIQAVPGYVPGSILIDKLPESESDFKRVYDKPAIEVCYVESDFDGPQNTSPAISQDETETFQLMIRARILRGQKGIYHIAELARLALVGFKPTGCQEGMYLTKFHFHDRHAEKEFLYIMHFKVKSTIVEDFDEPAGVPVNIITFNPTITP